MPCREVLLVDVDCEVTVEDVKNLLLRHDVHQSGGVRLELCPPRRQLGERLEVTKQAAAQTAKTLEEMGLIERLPNDRDRRSRILTHTERGQEMPRRSAAAFRARMRTRRQAAGDDNIDTTLATLAMASVDAPRLDDEA